MVSYCASGDMLGGGGGACWWVLCGGVDHGFLFFVVSYGCGFWLFTGPPSTLDYVLSYLFSFISLGFN